MTPTGSNAEELLTTLQQVKGKRNRLRRGKLPEGCDVAWLYGMGKTLLGQGEEREVWTGEQILSTVGDGVAFYGENGTCVGSQMLSTGIGKTKTVRFC